MHLDALSLFGLVSVSLMLVFYALEARSPGFVLAFAIACLMGSAYGFLQGAWPFGLVEGVWSIIAVWRWRQRSRAPKVTGELHKPPAPPNRIGDKVQWTSWM